MWFGEVRWSRVSLLVLGLLLGVQVLLEQDAELLAQGLELREVLLVLLLVLDLGLDACCDHTVSANRHVCDEIKLMVVCHTLEDAHGSGEVVNPPGGPQGGRADGRRGNQIVGEGVIQVALRRVARVSVSPVCPAWPGSPQPWGHTHLELENILDAVEFLLVSVSAVLPSAIDPFRYCFMAQLTPIDPWVEL